MRRLLLAMVLSSVSFVIGCNGDVRPPETRLPIIAEWKDDYAPADETRSQPQKFVITDPKKWEEVWELAFGNRLPQPPVPQIDFDSNMVIAVFMGVRGWLGYEIRITKVVVQGGEVVVFVRRKELKFCPGYAYLPATCAPFHIIVIPKVSERVRFVEKVVYEC